MYYVPHIKEWATCYRVGTIVNTYMFVESFHCVLKVVYFNNKQNRRVEHLIHTLLRMSRNLIYEKLQKVEKKKIHTENVKLQSDIRLLKNYKRIQHVHYNHVAYLLGEGNHLLVKGLSMFSNN